MSKRLTIKNHHAEQKLYFSRSILSLFIIICLFIILITRFFYLQVIRHHTYTTLSQQNRLELVPIAPNRGLIFDRNGILLAENQPVFSLEINPSQVKNLKKTIKNLQKIIPINDEEIETFNKTKKQRRHFSYIPLKFRLTSKEVAEFAVNQYRFPGVAVGAYLMRHYPKGADFAHVIGYVGRINTKELKQLDNSNYSATNFIGKVGIEDYYEEQLHGKVGYQEIEIDATGRIIRTLERVPPIPGNSLYLTIDSNLQKISQKAFEKKRGAMIAIQPETGEILAMVSNPTYDPNQFVTGISQKNYEALTSSQDQPLYNRAIRGQYPFGSVIKPFLALEGLISGAITAKEKIYDPGWYKLDTSSHIYHDWTRHGYVDLYKSIVVSCDTYYYDLANMMGIEAIDEILEKFGFGKKTNIDMNDELKGLIPSPEWKMKNKHQSWYPGDTLISGIGQGFMLTTPLQLAKATASLANRGLTLKPHLVTKIKHPNQTITPIIPTSEESLQARDEYWDSVIKAMQGVIIDKHGTGIRFGRNHPYTVAAKTGTAQVFRIDREKSKKERNLPIRLRDNSLFIAFAPIENPKIAVAVIVENNEEAPLIARKIIDGYLLDRKAQNDVS